MSGKTTDRFDWRPPLYATLAAIFFFIAAAIFLPNIPLLLYVLVVVPSLLIAGIFWLVRTAIRKKGRRCLSIASTLAIFGVISAALFVYDIKNPFVIRTHARWLAWSRDYKAEVLAQPTAANGELKHIEWDGWGFAGQDTTMFLVFDPTDSLSGAAASGEPGKFDGIPCDVARVRRLERHWYTVVFYTDEYWGRCS